MFLSVPVWTAVFLLSGAAEIVAQPTEGSIRGHIRDAQGSFLSEVRVTATSAEGSVPVVAIATPKVPTAC